MDDRSVAGGAEPARCELRAGGTPDAPGDPGETSEAGDSQSVVLSGRWTYGSPLPSPDDVLSGIRPGVRRLAFVDGGISEWDTALLVFLTRIVQEGRARDFETDRRALPAGARRLLDLAFAVPERTGTARGDEPTPVLARIGNEVLGAWSGVVDGLAFVGEATLAFGRFLVRRARYSRAELAVTIQECGAQALGITGLISVLVGVILAFTGAVQLELFGAEIYVADLVAIGMAREMAAVMTAIVMAGRTGAAFAAQLGTMTLNEEIDALRTMGVSPMDFLVLPRMLALMVMMPLLYIYANLLGILGGYAVAIGLLDISHVQFWNQTREALSIDHFTVGLVKSATFGVLVAVAGCMRGMQCERSAAAVGTATTSAVVTAIVWIVASDALFTYLFHLLDV